MNMLNDAIFKANYKGNKYMILEGDLEGCSGIAVKWRANGSEYYITLRIISWDNPQLNGKMIDLPFSRFDEIIALESLNTEVEDTFQDVNVPNPQIKDNPFFEVRDLKPKEGSVNNQPAKETKKEVSNPIELILSNLKNTKKEEIEIKYNFEIVDEATYNLLTSMFDAKKTYTEVLDFFIKKIDVKSVEDMIKKEIESYIKREFKVTIEEEDDEDVVEGIIIT
jgi:hypothetical protein